VSVIPIRRDLATRKGWYRAVFHDLPGFTLLVPIAFTGHLTFADLCTWPASGAWKQLTYVPAPQRTSPIRPRARL
jgi:hypothetical protein